MTSIRFIDYDVATGVYPDMREHGWAEDAWPDEIWPLVNAADILVIGGPLWLGDNASVTRRLIERLYAMSGLFNDKGQYIYYGKVGGVVPSRVQAKRWRRQLGSSLASG